MAEYTFTIDARDLASERTVTAILSDDQAAIGAACTRLDPAHQSVSVGRGRGDELEWLGAWDWNEGEPRWTAEE